MAVVFRHGQDYLFDPNSGPDGELPFLHRIQTQGVPLPPTVGFPHFMDWVEQIILEIGIDPSREEIRIEIKPEAITTRPIANSTFTLAVVDIPTYHYDRFVTTLYCPVVNATKILQETGKNLFYALIATLYRHG